MTVANIIRPEIEANYWTKPNSLSEYARHTNLKARDIVVLDYLLSKPSKWKVRAVDIVNGVGFCERTVRTALRALMAEGFATYTRGRNGVTDWTISVPENLLGADLKPCGKNYRGNSYRGKNCTDIIKNEIPLTKNEKETTAVAACEPVIDYINEPTPVIESKEIAPIGATQKIEEQEKIEIDLPKQLTPIEKTAVKKVISKLETPAMTAVLNIFRKHVAAGSVKSPVAYAASLVKKVNSGEIDVTENSAPIGATEIAQPVESRADKICKIFAKNETQIRADLKNNGYFLMGYETVTKSEFEELGLIERASKTISGGKKLSFSEMMKIATEKADEIEQKRIRQTIFDNTAHEMEEIKPVPMTEKEIAAREQIAQLEARLKASGGWVEPSVLVA